ncbi:MULTISPECIES: tRNA pseudouridine(38-40) synthase TruA [unclassified Anabaena]|uniref:tRNA pseudouridine(38-40) synthase TruA n=1 Tax=unclassified Anabaena TaxID=2619674 RepID=UPI0014462A56|nr:MULTISPECIES: tRNA pseudouridine(38-40) synthase TruA [unclassified Anabaena]MTJ09100.1 tRNA pseudouridine(38-40) synthase TruA [Anabaena sp. UHCC 0204]MTJ52206.1 tRNA pseudouridine(38-40) synthase TruA [Anabaena sp. UHCC 0253]
MLESSQQKSTQRVALVIQYLGTHFHGWQRQKGQRTVQEEIETAIATVLGYHVTLHGAGRTDSGVHAAAQVAHFQSTSLIPAHRWAKVLNGYLPPDVLIRASVGVTESWHARFSAIYRRYRYTIYTEDLPNLFVKPFSWHYYYAPLDETLIASALKPLVGKHHLSAFHRAGSARSHSWVEVQAVECHRSGSFIHIEIQANGFLYGMVRLLIGMVVQVGSGERSLDNFTDIWQQERREEVKYSAPAHGLCLLRVGYDDFPLPPKIWYDTQPYLIMGHK